MDGPISSGSTPAASPASPALPQPLHDLERAWPPFAQYTTAALLLLALALIGWHTLAHARFWGRPSDLTPAGPLTHALDLNLATAAELSQVPGLSPKLAERIVASRSENPFTSLVELRRVPGVGPKTFERARGWLKVEGGTVVTTVSRRVDLAAGKSVPALSKKAQALGDKKINVNLASLQELKLLPGIGDKKAEQIIAERARKPFREVADLRRVSGIGVKTLEQIRPWAVIEGPPVQLGKHDGKEQP